MMTVEDIQKICKKLKGVTQDIKWDDHLCFLVGGKMFVVTAPDHVPVSASFKAKDERFEELSSRDGMAPAPYMARHKWVYVENINKVSKKEWEVLIHEAYAVVALKLPAKVKKQLGIVDPL